KQTWKEVWHDLRSGRWGRVGLWLLFFCWVIFILLVIYSLGSYDSSSSFSDYTSRSAYQPDGNFSPFIGNFKIWDSSGFFEITLRLARVDFIFQLTLMDWQLVGRFGQTILAYVSWRTFADYISTSMAHSPITYRTFWIVFIQNEPGLTSIFRLMRDSIKYRRLELVVAMLFMVATMVFLLAWPTLASAMTGYTTANEAYIKSLDDENTIKFSYLKPLSYVIHD
ncbi:uncharacterized protein BCR38DRAFT_310813, partial [Pseudomassariella vexata]